MSALSILVSLRPHEQPQRLNYQSLSMMPKIMIMVVV